MIRHAVLRSTRPVGRIAAAAFVWGPAAWPESILPAIPSDHFVHLDGTGGINLLQQGLTGFAIAFDNFLSTTHEKSKFV